VSYCIAPSSPGANGRVSARLRAPITSSAGFSSSQAAGWGLPPSRPWCLRECEHRGKTQAECDSGNSTGKRSVHFNLPAPYMDFQFAVIIHPDRLKQRRRASGVDRAPCIAQSRQMRDSALATLQLPCACKAKCWRFETVTSTAVRLIGVSLRGCVRAMAEFPHAGNPAYA